MAPDILIEKEVIKILTYKEIRENPAVRTYIEMADYALKSLGLTEHSMAHTVRCAETTGWLLTELGYDERTVELGKIAGLMHDIGNMINRADHAHSGAMMAFKLLTDMGMSPEDVSEVVIAIGYHDEHTAHTITPINSALIIADKSDVRYTRVRDFDPVNWDIHDRVNYAVKKSELFLEKGDKTITLALTIDTDVSNVADYFEIFLNRMLLCRKAASYFNLTFKLEMNGTKLL